MKNTKLAYYILGAGAFILAGLYFFLPGLNQIANLGAAPITPTTGGGTGIGSTSSSFAGRLFYASSVSANGTITYGFPPLVGDAAGGLQAQTVLDAPDYLYANNSFKISRITLGSSSQNLTTPILSPQHIVFIGDSLLNISTSEMLTLGGQYGDINSLGFVHFFNNVWGTNLTTYAIGGTCVASRNNSTGTASAWGIAGSRLDCPNGGTVSVAPSTNFPFDTFHVWYNLTNGGGNFTYNVDGGTNTTIVTATSSADSLGVVNGTSTVGTTHTINLTVSSGSVRFYGIDFSRSAQSGYIFHVLESGGSQALQWDGKVGYTASFIAAVKPAMVVIWLGANDAAVPTASPSSTFVTNIRDIISQLNLTTSTPVVVMTNTPRGLTNTGPEDTAFTALTGQYRDRLLQQAPAGNYSVFDTRAYWPDYTTAFNLGMFSDLIHPTNLGAYYTYSGLFRALFPTRDAVIVDNLPDQRQSGASVLLPDNGTANFGSYIFQSNGGTADIGTGFTFPNSTAAQWKSQNVVVATLGATGVGIGTGNINAKLAIQGSSTLATDSSLIVRDISNNVLLQVNNNGTVGIGTSSPASLLEINSGSNNSILLGNQTGFNGLSNVTEGMLFRRASDGVTLNGIFNFNDATATGLPDLGVKARNDFAVFNNAGENFIVKVSGKVGVDTVSPSSTLHVVGNIQFSSSSTVITPSISGALVGLGCDSATTSIDTTVSSSTAAFITTPQNDPGTGVWFYSFLSAPNLITTRVCSDVAVTPNASTYVVKIIK
jgi:hypothetical protein